VAIVDLLWAAISLPSIPGQRLIELLRELASVLDQRIHPQRYWLVHGVAPLLLPDFVMPSTNGSDALPHARGRGGSQYRSSPPAADHHAHSLLQQDARAPAAN